MLQYTSSIRSHDNTAPFYKRRKTCDESKRMKNGRENIIAAIEFTSPERLPMVFDAFSASDVHRVRWNQIGPGDRDKKSAYDEWHCGWSRSDMENMGQVTSHPLDDWSKLDGYQWIDPDDSSLYEGMEDRFAGSDGKYIATSIFMIFFERLHSLRGFQNLMLDLYVDKRKISELADRVVDIQVGIIENISRRFPDMIDGIRFTDDWGSEQDVFISPDLWDEFMRPRYKRIFDACKNAGWHVWLHSCGKINKIIGGLIDVGVDVLNLQQPRVLGIEEIGTEFAGKICFESLCDIQKTLPFKGKDDIKREAQELISHWGTNKGGFILGDYGDGEAINVPLEKKRTMFDAFMDADRWKGEASRLQCLPPS
jgi:uroporphyrinogen decarboxylase